MDSENELHKKMLSNIMLYKSLTGKELEEIKNSVLFLKSTKSYQSSGQINRNEQKEKVLEG